MQRKASSLTIPCTEQRPFKIPQLPALRAVVSEPALQKRRFFLLLYLQPAGSLTILVENVFQQPSPTSITRRRQGLQTSFSEYGCSSALVLPTQRLTRPNGAVLSPPAGRRSSLCQQHRDPGIEWTCISSLCPSASRPSKVGPGFCPELRPAYSQTLCLPCRKAGNLRPDTMQTAYLSSSRKGTKMVLSTRRFSMEGRYG